jgi:hypothetical protein
MALIISGIFLFWLAARKPAWLWLALPIGLFWDFWRQQPLGFSGLKILLLGSLVWLFFGQSFRPEPKLKI